MPWRIVATGSMDVLGVFACVYALCGSCFFLLFLSLLLVWVSLDAFVIAGNPSFLLVCPWALVS